MSQASHRLSAAHLAEGARLAIAGIAINVLLAIVKLLAGYFGHAYALIADGFESTLDIGGSLVIWGGLKFAARPPDKSHPYGHGKAEPIAAMGVAIGVVLAAIALSLESIREIMTPHHAPAPFTLAVLVVVVAVKEGMYQVVRRLGDKSRSMAVQTDALHHRSDALTSIAAFIGISIALIGGPGYEAADDWAALLACAWIAYNGSQLFLPALKDVMDTAPSPEVEEPIRAAAKSVEGVVEVDQCRVRKMGLDYYVDLHIEVDGNIPVSEGHSIAHRVKDRVRAENPFIADVLVHVEPAGRK